MTQKWCLVKSSDGGRGLNGKKKIYEVVVDNTEIFYSWGMAEKPNRQRQHLTMRHSQDARWTAIQKVQEKLDKGYTLAYTA